MYTGVMHLSVYEVTKITRSKSFWKDFIPEKNDFQQAFCPSTFCDSFGTNTIQLVNGVFSEEELVFLTKEAQWLEENGKLTKRGKLKKGS